MPVYGRCLEGPNGTPCPSAQALGTAAALGAATEGPVGVAGDCPLAIRRSSQASAPAPAAVVAPAACVASIASSSAMAMLGLGTVLTPPSSTLGA